MNQQVFLDRRGIWAFWLGIVGVTTGVLLHMPMFLMGRQNGFALYGMPMDWSMIFGMYLIIASIGLAAYGLLPSKAAYKAQAELNVTVIAPEDAPLSRAHITLMIALVVALIIDVMKPASLGFTVPGMIKEYQTTRAHVSLVPFFALIGTASGSVLWGILADLYGRKAAILLSAVVFVGTSICGAMPSLNWNIGMCFMMGIGAGGMLPVTYALLAETMPSRHRGWALVLIGGLGAVGGYFAASAFSALLVPILSWRILWLLNLPTGLLLLAMGGLIPESATFLLARGRTAEAHKVMAKFGTISARKIRDDAHEIPDTISTGPGHGAIAHAKLWTPELIGKTAALTIAALSWGLINFGLLLWMPNDLVAKGYSMGVSSRLLGGIRADCFPHRLPLHAALQSLEHQVGAGLHDRGHAARLGVGAPARDPARRQSRLPDRAAHHRQQRHHCDSAALRGRMLPTENPWPRHRPGCGLHERRRCSRANPEHHRTRADSWLGGCRNHRAGDSGARAFPPLRQRDARVGSAASGTPERSSQRAGRRAVAIA